MKLNVCAVTAGSRALFHGILKSQGKQPAIGILYDSERRIIGVQSHFLPSRRVRLELLQRHHLFPNPLNVCIYIYLCIHLRRARARVNRND